MSGRSGWGMKVAHLVVRATVEDEERVEKGLRTIRELVHSSLHGTKPH